MDSKDIVQSDTGGFLRAAGNDDVLRFRASTDMIDRHRSIVKQGGIDAKHYSGAFLWGHDSFKGFFGGTPEIKNNLGKVLSRTITKFEREGKDAEATDIDVRFSKVNPFAVMAQGMVREGILGNTSIAFIPKKAKREEIDGEEIRIYEKVELLEISLVPVPSNPEAQALVRAMGHELEDLSDKFADDRLAVSHREDVNGTWYYNRDGAWSFRSFKPIEKLLDEEIKGIVPANVSNVKAAEATPWSAPALADFTLKAWTDLTTAERRRVMGHYAWAPSGDSLEFGFSDLKLPHHRASNAQVVLRGAQAAMGALLGARGGVNIPGADRRKVYNHLASHLRDFNRVPPPFRAVDDPPLEGADIGSVDRIVSQAMRDWVANQKSA